MNIVFFGSFQHYSALILDSLIRASHASPLQITAVVTTPPKPVGRQQIITKTPVHLLAEQHHLPVFTPSTLTPDKNSCRSVFLTTQGSAGSRVESKIYDERIESKPDIFLTAGYGKILPQSWLTYPKHGSLNLHFSLLPKYRGANPAEWAIMCGETTTGITLMKMNQGFDTGDILAQASIPIDPTDSRETLYQKLYELGAQKLPHWLTDAETLAFQHGGGPRLRDPSTAKASFESPIKQPTTSPTPHAYLLKRQDGFLPWETVQKFLHQQPPLVTDFPSPHLQTALNYFMTKDENPDFQRADMRSDASTAKLIRTFISNLPRALAGYPSLWTIVPTPKGDKRMKIISFTKIHDSRFTIHEVHIEGQQPALYNQIRNVITND